MQVCPTIGRPWLWRLKPECEHRPPWRVSNSGEKPSNRLTTREKIISPGGRVAAMLPPE